MVNRSSRTMLTVTCSFTALNGVLALLVGRYIDGGVGIVMSGVGALLMIAGAIGLYRVSSWSDRRRPGA